MDTLTEQCQMKVSEMQRRLAEIATEQKAHRFTNLYDLLTWEPLLIWAFHTLMTNSGSRTAGTRGMDKRTAIKHQADILMELRAELKSRAYRPQPVRRVYIPKANGKQRPLGIPTLKDRLVQLMLKAILEPIYESDFHQTSHGFRPKRSCHTAMAQLHCMTAPRQKKLYWTIEGDICGCFDHVQHTILMRLLKKRIQDKQLLGVIWQLLEAGVMEGTLFAKTTEGTPQGGICSPLLANIYLHELDEWFHRNYTGLIYTEKNRRRKRKEGNAFYVRYADDFVVAWNGTKEGAQRLKAEVSAFLRDHLGLELSAEKTRITHVTEGYDFLGFTVRREVDAKRGYDELLFYPSKQSVMKLKRKIKDMTKRGTTTASVRDKMRALNLLLGGWTNYFRHSVASRTFSYVDSYAFLRLGKWLHGKTGHRRRAIKKRYYRRHAAGYLTWMEGGVALVKTTYTTKISFKRYAHQPNPYLDSTMPVELSYHLDPYPGKRAWDGSDRYGEHWSEVREMVRQRDRNRCQLCGSEQRVEIHHIRKHHRYGEHNPARLIALCAACHRQQRDPQSQASRQLARYYLKTGEPDVSKDTSPVRRET